MAEQHGYVKGENLPVPGAPHRMLSDDDIQMRFGAHNATMEGPNPNEEIHKYIRREFVNMAMRLDEILPKGRGKSVMFTELETASMWAHKTLAGRD